MVGFVLSKVKSKSNGVLRNLAAQHRVHLTSAWLCPHFRGSGPIGGFGVWRFHPPNPALTANACRVPMFKLYLFLPHQPLIRWAAILVINHWVGACILCDAF
jgi:hypothetical protein